jgi:hypothetical protein
MADCESVFPGSIPGTGILIKVVKVYFKPFIRFYTYSKQYKNSNKNYILKNELNYELQKSLSIKGIKHTLSVV